MPDHRSRLGCRLMLLLVAGLACSCASAGQKFDTTHVNDIQKKVHDKTQITAWFGPPNSTAPIQGSAAGCVERWTYVYAHSTAGVSTKSESLVVDFDAAGKVCDHAYVKM